MAPPWPTGKRGPGPVRQGGHRQHGVAYLGLMAVVALLGLALAAAGSLWSAASRRDHEAELLFVGAQFRQAIASFYDHTPAGQPARFPRDLDELLDDKRWPTTRRHLRKRFVDPVLGRAEWGLVRAPGGGVMGVHSLSDQRPFKQAGFPPGLEGLAQAGSYRGWVFVYGAGGALAQPAAAGTPPALTGPPP